MNLALFIGLSMLIHVRRSIDSYILTNSPQDWKTKVRIRHTDVYTNLTSSVRTIRLAVLSQFFDPV